MQKIIALIVAAGRGSRFGTNTPKQYNLLRGEMVLRHTVKVFLEHPNISGVKVVIHPDDVELYKEAVTDLDVLPYCFGGKTRQESVICGLLDLKNDRPDTVLIHDAARPFVSSKIISDVISNIKPGQGAIPVIPVTDTIKKVNIGTGFIDTTLDRSALCRVQTPQGFMYADILLAAEKTKQLAVTDDAAMAEAYGIPVSTVPGSKNNVKITTLEDLKMANNVNETITCIGMGFDVHAFKDGDGVWLCGIKIPYSKSLEGHSDADVALHALADAIYGAIGAGDIGLYFPPSDMKWKNAASSIFLKHAVNMVRKKNGTIVNTDVTIICEEPKLGKYRQEMQLKIAELLGIHTSMVNIKGTTTERLGFTGRKEGIAAQAVVSVRLNR